MHLISWLPCLVICIQISVDWTNASEVYFILLRARITNNSNPVKRANRIKAASLATGRRHRVDMLPSRALKFRANQSILKEISPEYSLEGLMLKLKLQYFGHLMQRTDSLEKTLMLERWRQEKGMTEDEMVGWHHQLNGHEFEQVLGVGDGERSLACCSPWDPKELDMIDWTEVIAYNYIMLHLFRNFVLLSRYCLENTFGT